MPEKLTFTREELEQALELWNQEYVDDPESFTSIDASGDSAKKSVDTLLSYIDRIRE